MYCATLLVLIASVLLIVHAEVLIDELYSDKYDHMDVDAILANDELRNQYHDCFMDRGPCGEDAAYFKDHIPEVIVTRCRRCTKWQKEAFDKIADWFAINDEAAWYAFVEKYIAIAKAMGLSGAPKS